MSKSENTRLETIIVQTPEGKDLRFAGQLLADMARDTGPGRGIRKAIYRTAGGSYVLEVVHTTIHDGEQDGREVHQTRGGSNEVVEWFAEGLDALDGDTKEMLTKAGIDVCEDIE